MWQDLESPRAIAIDYEFGYLFFSDWGTLPRIERSDMDGEKRSRIVTSNLGWPNGLSVDKLMKNLYWTDAKVKRMTFINSIILTFYYNSFSCTKSKHATLKETSERRSLSSETRNILTEFSYQILNFTGLIGKRMLFTLLKRLI